MARNVSPLLIDRQDVYHYSTTVRDEIRDRLNLNPPTFEYEPELWPGYKGPMLIRDFEWRLAMFGMVPYFSKDGKDFRRTTYNARSETAHEKPTYRGPWSRRQVALIPMRAFFEPSYESGKAVRWRIERQDDEPFTVAALWDTWKPKDLPDSRLHSFSMLTMNADGHPLMGRFHAPGSEKRSLVVVPADLREAWLKTEDLGAFLREIPADEFTSQADPCRRVRRRRSPFSPSSRERSRFSRSSSPLTSLPCVPRTSFIGVVAISGQR